MAYTKFELPVFTAEEQEANDVWYAEQVRKSEEARAAWRKAQAEATFSDELTPEGFPKFYTVAGEVYEFELAANQLGWLAYKSTVRPFTSQILTLDLLPFDLEARIASAFDNN